MAWGLGATSHLYLYRSHVEGRPSRFQRQRLSDCGKSLPPQDAAIGNPENPWRFWVLPKWTIVRPHSRAGAMEGNPVRHDLWGLDRIRPACIAGSGAAKVSSRGEDTPNTPRAFAGPRAYPSWIESPRDIPGSPTHAGRRRSPLKTSSTIQVI